MEKYKIRLDADYQRAVDKFVNREVIYCVSYLISEMARKLEYSEEIRDILSLDQYINTFTYECDCEQTWEITDDDPNIKDTSNIDLSDYNTNCPKCNKIVQASECNSEYTDPIEVYEHWIVTDWLAAKLEERDHIIDHDFLGLTIWGRCATGQSISMDGYICDIFDDYYKEFVEEVKTRLLAEEQQNL